MSRRERPAAISLLTPENLSLAGFESLSFAVDFRLYTQKTRSPSILHIYLKTMSSSEQKEDTAGSTTPVTSGSSKTTEAAMGCGASLNFLMSLAALVVASLAFGLAKDNEMKLASSIATEDPSSATAATSTSMKEECYTGTITTSSFWNSPILGNGGSEITFEETATNLGARWPFAGDVHDVPEGEVVGRNIELCTFLGGTMWNCQGAYIDAFGCEGNLNFDGWFDTSTFTGVFTITGGTGDFSGAKGQITDAPDMESAGWFNREIAFA